MGHCYTESFKNMLDYSMGKRVDLLTVVRDLVVLFVTLFIVGLTGSYLWNNSVANLFKGVNKANWTEIVLLFVFLNIFM